MCDVTFNAITVMLLFTFVCKSTNSFVLIEMCGQSNITFPTVIYVCKALKAWLCLTLMGQLGVPVEVTNQYVSAGDAAEPQVLDSSLLKLHVSVAELAVWAQDILDRGLYFWKQVNELDVGRQQQCPSWHRAQVELGV